MQVNATKNQLDKLPETRREALDKGFPYYFTGKPCKHGHVSKRLAEGSCYECKLIRTRNFNSAYCKTSGYRGKRSRYLKRERPKMLKTLMIQQARARAKKAGLPCTIQISDINVPEFCPILGMKLVVASGYGLDDSPSLDRIRPELGYVPGNVQVISKRANMLKNCASLEEIEKIYEFLKDINDSTI
jgi:hypothetical protein